MAIKENKSPRSCPDCGRVERKPRRDGWTIRYRPAIEAEESNNHISWRYIVPAKVRCNRCQEVAISSASLIAEMEADLASQDVRTRADRIALKLENRAHMTQETRKVLESIRRR